MKTVLRRLSILIILVSVVTAFALSKQCQARTKGVQCKKKAQVGSLYCRQHTRMYGTGYAQPTAPVKTESTAPAKTEPTEPAKTEPPVPDKTRETSPAKTEQPVPAKTEPTDPAKTGPTVPAKTE